MYDAIWFKEAMLKRWKKEVELNQVGYETIMLTPKEVDEGLIPLHAIESLPNPLLAHSFIHSFTLRMREMNGSVSS